MKTGLDTSVILRLLTGEPDPQARCALAEVKALLGQGTILLVSDLVVAELYFALQHHYAVPKAEALTLIANFLNEKGIQSDGAAASVLAVPNLATAKPGFVDRMIHAAYTQQSADEMLSFEKAARRLPGVRVLTVEPGP
jgi:predicted nucleic-acid-binding protein